jgi:hypothetical protein
MRGALVVGLALLAGCGGGGGDSADKGSQTGSSGDTMSAAAWSRKVEAICEKSAAEASKKGNELGRKSAAAGDSRRELAAKTLALTSRLVDPWMDKVEALPKPKGREQAADQFVANMRDVGDLLSRTATAIKQNDEATGKKLVAQLKAKGLTAQRQAQALHIEKCNPPSA